MIKEMPLKLNKFLSKTDPSIVYIIATTFLTAIWIESGFRMWENLEWVRALAIWILYLGTALLGYYIGGVLTRLQNELRVIVSRSVGLQPDLADLREKESQMLHGLVQRCPEYSSLWWEFLALLFLTLIDIGLLIRLHIAGLVK